MAKDDKAGSVTAVKAAIDIGNGYVKASLNNEMGVDLPSTVSMVTGQNRLPLDDDKAGEWASGDVYNTLDASFEMPMVKDRLRRIFGKAALSTDGVLDQFPISGGRQSKSEYPLSYILIFGIVAAKALKDWVLSHDGRLPENGMIEAQADLALTLPITEFEDRRASYKARLTEVPVVVTVHNFASPVVVRITVPGTDHVKVIAEGASAQLAINAHGVPLMSLLLDDAGKHGVPVKGYGPEDVLAARDFIGVDIGEGTVNFPVFTDGVFNVQTSTTMGHGYGTVLERALRDMENERVNAGLATRKQLADYLIHEPSPMKRDLYNLVSQYVERERTALASEIAVEFGHLLDVVGARNEVAYVYGGGATPMKDDLYPKLVSQAKQLGFPVLYMDSRYSRVLNREGLAIAVGLKVV